MIYGSTLCFARAATFTAMMLLEAAALTVARLLKKCIFPSSQEEKKYYNCRYRCRLVTIDSHVLCDYSLVVILRECNVITLKGEN